MKRYVKIRCLASLLGVTKTAIKYRIKKYNVWFSNGKVDVRDIKLLLK